MPDHEEEFCNATRVKVDKMEKQNIVMCEDMKHLVKRIDNGMSVTITKIWDKVNALSEIKSKVDDHEFWVSKVKWAFIWLGVVGVLGGGLGIALTILKRGI